MPVVKDPAVPFPVLAADIGATNIRTALVRPDGTVTHRQSTATRGADLLPALLDCLDRTAQAYRADSGPAPGAVAIAALGPIDRAAGGIELATTLGPGAGLLALRDPVARATGLPVHLERDTIVAGFGEAAFGAARGRADFLYLTVSSGIGAALFSGGRPLLGVNGLAGEIGHLPVDLGGPACVCGLRGCLETLASGSGIAAAAGDGRDAREIGLAALAGEAQAASVVDRAARALAAGVVAAVNAFDPGFVVIGGSVALGLGGRVLDPVREAVRRFAYGAAARRTAVVAAALGDDAGLAGGVVLGAPDLVLPLP